MKIKYILATLIAGGLSMYPLVTLAEQMLPPNWPWKGVSINGIDYNPHELETLVKKVNINSIQLRLLPRNLAAKEKISPKEAWQRSLSWGDAMLDEAKKLGLVAIMTVENFPLNPNLNYIQTSPQFWESENDTEEVIHLAFDLGLHFANRGNELAAYQVLSEPTLLINGQAKVPQNWEIFTNRILSAIRINDSKHWIAIAPPPWGLPSSYRGFKPFEDNKIIYGAHMYFPHEFTHQGIQSYISIKTKYPGIINWKYWDKEALADSMHELREFQVKYQAPIWIGEFSAIIWSEGGEEYLVDLASIFNSYGWSWTYFSLNGYFGWNPNFDNKNPIPLSSWEQNNVGFGSKRWGALEQMFNLH